MKPPQLLPQLPLQLPQLPQPQHLRLLSLPLLLLLPPVESSWMICHAPQPVMQPTGCCSNQALQMSCSTSGPPSGAGHSC
jgi:hypothetical protein